MGLRDDLLAGQSLAGSLLINDIDRVRLPSQTSVATMPRLTGRLVVASHNSGKVREIAALLGPLGVEAVSAGELGPARAGRDGTTFAGNAALKARGRGFGVGTAALWRMTRGSKCSRSVAIRASIPRAGQGQRRISAFAMERIWRDG